MAASCQAGSIFPSFSSGAQEAFWCTWKPCTPAGKPVNAGWNTSPYGVSLMVTSPAAATTPWPLTRFSGTLMGACRHGQRCCRGAGQQGQLCNTSFHDRSLVGCMVKNMH
jgi:hypothetical protein